MRKPSSVSRRIESRALESLWEVFGQAREAMKKYPGCNEFADLVTEMTLVKHPFRSGIKAQPGVEF